MPCAEITTMRCDRSRLPQCTGGRGSLGHHKTAFSTATERCGAMHLATAIFALTYVLASLGEISPRKLDRPTATLLGAVLMVTTGSLSRAEAVAVIAQYLPVRSLNRPETYPSPYPTNLPNPETIPSTVALAPSTAGNGPVMLRAAS